MKRDKKRSTIKRSSKKRSSKKRYKKRSTIKRYSKKRYKNKQKGGSDQDQSREMERAMRAWAMDLRILNSEKEKIQNALEGSGIPEERSPALQGVIQRISEHRSLHPEPAVAAVAAVEPEAAVAAVAAVAAEEPEAAVACMTADQIKKADDDEAPPLEKKKRPGAEDMCVICQVEFGEEGNAHPHGLQPMKSPCCNNFFHKGCIGRMLESGSILLDAEGAMKCPLCRAPNGFTAELLQKCVPVQHDAAKVAQASAASGGSAGSAGSAARITRYTDVVAARAAGADEETLRVMMDNIAEHESAFAERQAEIRRQIAALSPHEARILRLPFHDHGGTMPLGTMHRAEVDTSDPELVTARAEQRFRELRDRAAREHHQRMLRADLRRRTAVVGSSQPNQGMGGDDVTAPQSQIAEGAEEDPDVTYARRLAALPQENEVWVNLAQLALAFEFGHITEQEYITALQEIPQ